MNDTATTYIYTLSYTTLFRSTLNEKYKRALDEQGNFKVGPLNAQLTNELEQLVKLFPGVVTFDSATGMLRFNSRSEEHTSELQSQSNLVCRLLLEKKKKKNTD